MTLIIIGVAIYVVMTMIVACVSQRRGYQRAVEDMERGKLHVGNWHGTRTSTKWRS
jgi:hypothetical protein